MLTGSSTRLPGVRAHAIEAHWQRWDGGTTEVLRLGWESGGWTADGRITGLNVQYAIRFDGDWRVRQFLLFRDLEEPDLWLVSDGHGRWAEMNGVERTELTGCTDIELNGSPFAASMSGRRLGLSRGDKAHVMVARIDSETLDVSAHLRRVERVGDVRWSVVWADDAGEPIGDPIEFDVDDQHLTGDQHQHFRRTR
jgi:uncharacterized protein